MTERASTLADNLALVSGPVAQVVAERLTAMNQELSSAIAERDTLASKAAATARPVVREERRVSPAETIYQATEMALRAGWEACRSWIGGEWAKLHAEDYELYTTVYSDAERDAWDDAERLAHDRVRLPRHDSEAGFHAWQAALAALNLAAVLYPDDGRRHRWEATMVLPGGKTTSNMVPTQACRRP